jgi:hypothetical protein
MSDRHDKVQASRSLSEKLKTKGRGRREALRRLAAAAPMPRARRNDILPHLELTYLPLHQLEPAPKKLRKLDPAHVREIAATIAELGFCDPILIGKENVVLNGEARLEAAKLHGLDRIPCIQVGHLNEKEQRVLRLAVNRLAEKGDWDLDQLKIEFEELIIEEAPIDVSGFTLDEIDQIIIADEAEAIEQGPLEPDDRALAIARAGGQAERRGGRYPRRGQGGVPGGGGGAPRRCARPRAGQRRLSSEKADVISSP